MQNIIKLLISTILIFLLNGCSIDNKNVDFSNIANNITIGITNEVLEDIDLTKNTNLYITDFMNISSLDNKSQLGFILSSDTKVAILKQGIKIKELTIGKNLKIGKHGIKLLSRQLSNIKDNKILPNSKIIVGTYAITSTQLIVYLKLIDIQSGNILFSKSTSTPITQEIINLEGIETKSNIYTPMVL